MKCDIPKGIITQMVPQFIKGEVDLVQVDTFWGIIQPLHVANGMRTTYELDRS